MLARHRIEGAMTVNAVKTWVNGMDLAIKYGQREESTLIIIGRALFLCKTQR